MKPRLPRRWVSGWLALVLLAPAASSRGLAQSSRDPDAVLKTAGLQRTGNSFVLDGELEVKTLGKKIEDLQQKLTKEMQRKQGLDAAQAKDKQMAAQWRQQADRLRQQARATKGANQGKAQNLERQARDLDQKASRALRTDGQDRQQNQQEAETVRKIDADQKELKKLQSQRQDLVQKTMKKYRELGEKPEIVQALRKLNKGSHPKVALGPIPDHDRNVVELCVDHLRDLGLNREQNLFYLADDDEVVEKAAAENLRIAKLRKEGPLDDSTRAELAKTVQTLRKQIEDLEARRGRLNGDDEVADLLSEVQKGSKGQVRLATTVAFQRALKELGLLEKTAQEP